MGYYFWVVLVLLYVELI